MRHWRLIKFTEKYENGQIKLSSSHPVAAKQCRASFVFPSFSTSLFCSNSNGRFCVQVTRFHIVRVFYRLSCHSSLPMCPISEMWTVRTRHLMPHTSTETKCGCASAMWSDVLVKLCKSLFFHRPLHIVSWSTRGARECLSTMCAHRAHSVKCFFLLLLHFLHYFVSFCDAHDA